MTNETNEKENVSLYDYTSRLVVGNKIEMLTLASDNLSSILKWHQMLLMNPKDHFEQNPYINDYILNNRMENIKSIFQCFHEEVPYELASMFVATHLFIEEFFKKEDENKDWDFFLSRIFIDYFQSAFDIINYLLLQERFNNNSNVINNNKENNFKF